MTVEEILTVVRDLLDDRKGSGTPLWSDAELVEYANEAEARIADECLVLRDSETTVDASSNPVCVIPVASPYTNTLDLHPSIVKVFGVSYGAGRKPLKLTSVEVLDQARPTWRTQTGLPSHYCLDITAGQLVLDRVPTADASVYLWVARLPLVEMSKANLKGSPSIPRKYHRKLVNGIVGRAYLKQDAETLNLNKATVFNQQFAQDIEQIKRDELRLRRRGTTCLRRIW